MPWLHPNVSKIETQQPNPNYIPLSRHGLCCIVWRNVSAGGLGVIGHSVSPGCHNRASLTCTSKIAGASLRRSMLVNQAQEKGQDTAYVSTVNPSPPRPNMPSPCPYAGLTCSGRCPWTSRRAPVFLQALLGDALLQRVLWHFCDTAH